ncbi:winged helix-turn-helix domain-containing protein [Clostridioides difficile]|uniref:winged helix-turn-helix domain-containing protein n=1 Tax=Clostridioides difficile TaxID=1496 RepID=UPI002ED037CA
MFTPLEYRTLKLLTENPKSILTRKVLLEKLWDIDANFVDEHTLTSVISRIRSKIEKDNLKYIKTVYGMGYMWLGERNEF